MICLMILIESKNHKQRKSLYFLTLYSFMDTSIQENLRQKALNKKPSHRNWREWYAITDYLEDNVKVLCDEISYLHKLK